MRHTKYKSELERLLSCMITKCMRADGRIPRYMIVQQLRPTLTTDFVQEILKKVGIVEHTTPGRRGVYYLASDVLRVLEQEQNRLTEVEATPSGDVRRRRLWDQDYPNVG